MATVNYVLGKINDVKIFFAHLGLGLNEGLPPLLSHISAHGLV